MISGLLLAAGTSSRFGAQKLLATIAGESIVRLAAATLSRSGVDECVVVVGRDAEAVRLALLGLDVRFVENLDYALGIASSLRAGVAALNPRARALVIALGDQPRVPPGVTERLLAEWIASGAAIVAPSYHGERGHPVLFDARLFGELSILEGDVGARGVIARDPARVHTVEIGDAMPRDIDVREDLDGDW